MKNCMFGAYHTISRYEIDKYCVVTNIYFGIRYFVPHTNFNTKYGVYVVGDGIIKEFYLS